MLEAFPVQAAQGNSAPKTEDEALVQASVQFEAMFIGTLLKQMRSTTLESGLFGQDRASKIYREMYDDALAAEMAASGSLGIGAMMLQELRNGLSGAAAREAYAASGAGKR